MREYFQHLVLALAFVVPFQSAQAASSPIGGGTVPGFAQVPDYDGEIKGFRLNPGWGYHKVVYGLDLGLVGNTTSKEFVGIQLAGLFNTNLGKAYVVGMQFALGFNRNSGDAYIGGIQAALVNLTGKGTTHVYGLQYGMVNLGSHKIYGFQVGLVNQATHIGGLQIGLVNRTESLKGVQIGVVNIATKAPIKFFPLINISF